MKKYLDSGVSRVILGTAAVTDEEFLIAATSKYGSRELASRHIIDHKVKQEKMV